MRPPKFNLFFGFLLAKKEITKKGRLCVRGFLLVSLLSICRFSVRHLITKSLKEIEANAPASPHKTSQILNTRAS